MLCSLERLLEGETAESLDEQTLREAARYCATHPECTEVIENRTKEQLSTLILGLLDSAIDAVAEEKKAKTNGENDGLQRARLSLQALSNMANRSSLMKNSIPATALARIQKLLIERRILREVAAVLTAFALTLHHVCALDHGYDTLLLGIFHLWCDVEDDNIRSWLSAFISLLVEHDGAFLANVFGDLPPSGFTALLTALETMTEASEGAAALEEPFILALHPNNVQFLVDVVERILFDFSEQKEGSGEAEEERLSEYAEQLPLLAAVIANVSLAPCQKKELADCQEERKTRRTFDEQLRLSSSAANGVSRIVDVLETALAAESALLPPPSSRSSAPDRPAPPRLFQSAKVASALGLSSLSARLQSGSSSRALSRCAAYKCACVRAIGNLCCDSYPNQVAAGERGAVVLLLMCTKRREHDEFFLAQWAITALRFVVMGCSENQEILAGIDTEPTGAVDRERLLAELGLRAVRVEGEGGGDGKRVRLKKIERG